ncbi:Branched-chain amino acid transport protein AzlD [Selenomonas ruminantium]|uniref:Branched-chain amino acid transport protein AzlD n=1 Tax=Selenomonas ruminantium TaxID=971 RepID=A0A1I3C397_SELRU|nr:AzlD domain-containing protein [Selenomonas ruminantium]SFH69017.1 Branched-chain amino acid transport protein AzlD [Selenomonas ruminantium]
MSLTEQIITVLMVVAATSLTRFLSFALFPTPEHTPNFVRYLGKVLPAAVFGFLVVYCLRGVELTGGSHGLPEAAAVAVTAFIQARTHQMLLAIGGGTALYMLLVQLVFR